MNNTIRRILPNYFEILEGSRTANYLHCKHIPVYFDASESTSSLWKKHDLAFQNMKVADIKPRQSLLDLKIELAERIFRKCVFCERRCKVDRRKKTGNCGVKEARISSEFLHLGEEHILIPSYTIFFSGCTFHCVFCQNWDISQHIIGKHVEPEILAGMIDRRRREGAKNVNWVGGDPTPNIVYILKVLRACETNIPQIWNSNMYCSLETMKLLKGVVDLYLTDFKYGNDRCAERLSMVTGYTKVVKRNHRIAYRQGEIILRHLVMPNHTRCCSEKILQWIKENIPDVAVNIMSQYRPEYNAVEYEDISQPISMDEFMRVKLFAGKLNLNEI
ncbi:MAG: radical SAM protein [Thermoplasmata archaeon]|nr:MAG: radical SAM protein [Thermoplasmata archaeon]RLF35640.1 MAG: radical SAM protein [Thermoplasmata archaeon]